LSPWPASEAAKQGRPVSVLALSPDRGPTPFGKEEKQKNSMSEVKKALCPLKIESPKKNLQSPLQIVVSRNE
jgi:hypothetical protein